MTTQILKYRLYLIRGQIVKARNLARIIENYANSFSDFERRDKIIEALTLASF